MLISIIIPVHNNASTLRTCLRSVQTSSLYDWEAVVIDDGSKDGSEAICDRFALEDSRFKVIHTENRGVSAARNTGIQAAVGEWLAFADADDYFLPGAFETLLRLGREQRADIVCGAFIRTFSPEGYSVAQPHETSVRLYTQDELWPLVMRIGTQNCYYYIWNKIYRRALFTEDVFPEGLGCGEDVEATCRVLLNARRIAETNEVVYLYYQNPAGASLRGFSQNDVGLLEVWRHIEALMRERKPSQLKNAQINLARVDFTLLCRLILADNPETDACFARQEKEWLARMRQNRKLLLSADIPFSRRLTIFALAHAYGPTKAVMRLAARTWQKERNE